MKSRRLKLPEYVINPSDEYLRDEYSVLRGIAAMYSFGTDTFIDNIMTQSDIALKLIGMSLSDQQKKKIVDFFEKTEPGKMMSVKIKDLLSEYGDDIIYELYKKIRYAVMIVIDSALYAIEASWNLACDYASSAYNDASNWISETYDDVSNWFSSINPFGSDDDDVIYLPAK